jgi:hypothetical protein
VLNFKINQWVQ